MKKYVYTIMIFMISMLVGCGSTKNETTEKTPEEINSEMVSVVTEEQKESEVSQMKVQIGNVSFTASLEKNSTVDELIEMMRTAPIVIGMSDYSGFEKVGNLGSTLTTNNVQTTTQSGDIVLYNGNQIVIFYGSNSWNYTRLGKIDDLLGWEEALGDGDIEVTFSMTE